MVVLHAGAPAAGAPLAVMHEIVPRGSWKKDCMLTEWLSGHMQSFSLKSCLLPPPTAGMNNAVKTLVRYFVNLGHTVFGAGDGFEGCGAGCCRMHIDCFFYIFILLASW